MNTIRVDQPTVSVIIVNWNGGPVLVRCVKSVLESEYHNFELIVVDNASSDGSIEGLINLYGSDPRLHIIRLKKNVGFALANNIGAFHAKGEYLVFLNNDTVVERNWLKELLQPFLKDPMVAVTQAKLLSIDGRYIDGADDYIDRFGYPMILGHGDVDRGQYDQEREIFSARAAAMMVRVDVFRKVGMFDGTFFAGYEDVDLSWRIRLVGYRVMLCPRAVVWHVGGYSVKRVKELRSAPCKNLLALVAKNFEMRNFINSIAMMLLVYVYHILRAAVLSPGELRYCVKALLGSIKTLKLALRTRHGVQRIRRLRDYEILRSKLVFNGSIFIHLVAAGLLWHIKYKKLFSSFERFWNTWINRKLGWVYSNVTG